MQYEYGYLSDETFVSAEQDTFGGTIYFGGISLGNEAYEAIKWCAEELGWEKQAETQVTD